MTSPAFEIMCEIEPATGPDLTRVRRQIAVLTSVGRFVPCSGQPSATGHGCSSGMTE